MLDLFARVWPDIRHWASRRAALILVELLVFLAGFFLLVTMVRLSIELGIMRVAARILGKILGAEGERRADLVVLSVMLGLIFIPIGVVLRRIPETLGATDWELAGRASAQPPHSRSTYGREAGVLTELVTGWAVLAGGMALCLLVVWGASLSGLGGMVVEPLRPLFGDDTGAFLAFFCSACVLQGVAWMVRLLRLPTGF